MTDINQKVADIIARLTSSELELLKRTLRVVQANAHKKTNESLTRELVKAVKEETR